MYSYYEPSRSTKYGRTSTNMFLQFKWDIENYANHRFNVKTAKPRIDNSAPMTFTHMFLRPKKLQLELERYSTIQRNNRFLLERLATVQREGAWIDNRNYHEIKSLNTWKRQQEMIQLAYNNQIMIARLQDVSALQNRNRLEDEYLLNQKYKANILKYPPNWREIQEQVNLIKASTFKKVFESRNQKKVCQKSPKRTLAETQKSAAAKDGEAAKKTWRSTKEERLKLEEESKKKQQEVEKRVKIANQEKEVQRRQKEKEEIEKWKKKQEEEKEKEKEKMQKQQDIEKQEANKRIKSRLKRAEKKAQNDATDKMTDRKLDSVKKSETEKNKRIKDRANIETGINFEAKENKRNKEKATGRKGKKVVSVGETRGSVKKESKITKAEKLQDSSSASMKKGARSKADSEITEQIISDNDSTSTTDRTYTDDSKEDDES